MPCSPLLHRSSYQRNLNASSANANRSDSAAASNQDTTETVLRDSFITTNFVARCLRPRPIKAIELGKPIGVKTKLSYKKAIGYKTDLFQTGEQISSVIPKAWAEDHVSSTEVLPDVHKQKLLEEEQADFTILHESELRQAKERDTWQAHDITPRVADSYREHRMTLNGWLVEVHEHFELLPETLHLGLQILDRFFEHNPVKTGLLQVTGITAMMIAAKYSEVSPPTLSEWTKMCSGAYEQTTVSRSLSIAKVQKRGVKIILLTLLSSDFISNFCAAAGKGKDRKFQSLVFLICEVASLGMVSPKYLPSVSVVSAIIMANSLLGCDDFPEQLQMLSRCSVSDTISFRDEVRGLFPIFKSRFPALHKKFSKRSHHNVAQLLLEGK